MISRRSRLGESMGGCLLFIAISIGLIIWGYFKFIHWAPLNNADNPKSIVVFNEKENYPAYLEYGRRFRDSYSFQARSMITTEVGIIADFKKGKYKSDPSTLEQKLKEFNDNLLNGVTDLNGQQVPNRLKGSHLLVCRGYRLAYEASLALSEAAGAEGVERSNQVKMAESKAQAAWKAVNAGVAEHQHIWSTTGTSMIWTPLDKHSYL